MALDLRDRQSGTWVSRVALWCDYQFSPLTARHGEPASDSGHKRIWPLRSRTADWAVSIVLRLVDTEYIIPIVNRVERQEPGKPEWLAEQGYAYTNLARVLELQGELERSLDLYMEIAAINDKLLELEPENVEYQLEVGFAHNNIGKVIQSLGRLDDAQRHFKTDLEIKQAVSQSNPNHNLWRYHLATSHQYLGLNAMARGDYGAASSAFSSAIRIVTPLHGLDPDNTEWKEKLATNDRELAAAELKQARLEPARAALNESSKLWVELLQTDEKKWSWRTGEGLTRIYQALLALAEDDGAQSLAFSSAAREVFVELLEQNPGNLESRKNLTLAGLIDGDALAATGSRQSAVTTWNETLALLDKVSVVGQNPEFTELAAALHLRLGHDEQAQANLDLLEHMGYQPRFLSLPLGVTGPE